MRLLSRHLVVQKSYEVAYQNIKSCAYCLPKATFSEESFSMYCAKRFKGGIISLIPVKGTITQHNHLVEVTLSIHADLGIYLGSLLSILGIIGLFWYFFSCSSRWIPAVGSILLGILVTGQSIWEGRDFLDQLERKLLS